MISCQEEAPSNLQEQDETVVMSAETDEQTENFDWLLGKWKRLNEKEGKETFEFWNKVSPSKYKGIGFTLQNGDTIKRESITLEEENSHWHLAVEVLEEPLPTIFQMDHFGDHEFTCVNDSIEFPNKIEYSIESGQLKAKVSNPEFEILFEFEKMQD